MSMRKIKTYSSFCNEGFPVVFNDPIYGSDVFRIRYRAISDLSKHRNDAIPEPINDLLDYFQEGDIVRGQNIDGGKYVVGRIMRIKKDSSGENVSIKVKSGGEIITLAPSTVSFVDGGEVGNRKPSTKTPVDKEQMDLTRGDTFMPTTYE
jgi:hypothetical protein